MPNAKRTPGRPKTSEDSTNVQKQILSVASRLFMERGFDQVSLQEIAQSSGVTKASVYYYFANKANLFTIAVCTMMNNICYYTQQILNQEGSLQERLQSVVYAYLRTSHVDFESLMKEVSPHLSTEQLSAMRQAEGGIHELLAKTFLGAMEQGELSSGDPLFLSNAFYALMKIGQRDPLSGLFPSREKAAHAIVTFFWNGAAKREP